MHPEGLYDSSPATKDDLRHALEPILEMLQNNLPAKRVQGDPLWLVYHNSGEGMPEFKLFISEKAAYTFAARTYEGWSRGTHTGDTAITSLDIYC